MKTRALAAEALGTGFLLMAIVGSGIMAQRLSNDPGLQLLQNAIATSVTLAVLIAVFLPVSGAHLNPAVTLAERLAGRIDGPTALGYVTAQIGGGAGGAILANLMFGLPPISAATTARSGGGLILAEVVATAGLVLIIGGLVQTERTQMIPVAVGGFILGAFYFTSSTAFANPAVTIARTLSDTFTGIAPASVPGFIAAELAGTAIAVFGVGRLFAGSREVSQPADRSESV